MVRAALSDRELVQLKLGDSAAIQLDANPGQSIEAMGRSETGDPGMSLVSQAGWISPTASAVINSDLQESLK
jgi:hypothetical protein